MRCSTMWSSMPAFSCSGSKTLSSHTVRVRIADPRWSPSQVAKKDLVHLGTVSPTLDMSMSMIVHEQLVNLCQTH